MKTSLLTVCVMSLATAVGCHWTEISFPDPQIPDSPKIANTDMFNISMTPDGTKAVTSIAPDNLPWAQTCAEQARVLDPCLRAWTDDEIKFKRPQPIKFAINGQHIASYFHVRDEDGNIIEPERILSNPDGSKLNPAESFRRMELYDRRLWIEQADLMALAEDRVPGSATPASGMQSGILPRNRLPELMFRVGLSYDAACVKRAGEPNFNLGMLRDRGFVGRITGRFVAWRPDESLLQQMQHMTSAMAADSSPHQQLRLSWHKQLGSTTWWSDTIVMLSTFDLPTKTATLTFRRPQGLYDPDPSEFKNGNHSPLRLGDWLLRDNAAPYHLQTIFPSSNDANGRTARWTVPTILPRIPDQSGAIFIPASVEIIIATQNADTGAPDAVSLGCIPFEKRGLHGAVLQQITRQILPQQEVKHEASPKSVVRTDSMAGLLTGPS